MTAIGESDNTRPGAAPMMIPAEPQGPLSQSFAGAVRQHDEAKRTAASRCLTDATIDTGDTVMHGPSGEKWLVAHVQGEMLSWCGWPPGMTKLSEFILVSKATPEERARLLRQLADLPSDDHRRGPARRALGLDKEAGSTAPREPVPYTYAVGREEHIAQQRADAAFGAVVCELLGLEGGVRISAADGHFHCGTGRMKLGRWKNACIGKTPLEAVTKCLDVSKKLREGGAS